MILMSRPTSAAEGTRAARAFAAGVRGWKPRITFLSLLMGVCVLRSACGFIGC